MGKVKFKQGTQEAYNGATKNSDTLYFVSVDGNKGKLYKGEQLIGRGDTLSETEIRSLVAGAVQYLGVVAKAEDLGKDMNQSTPAAVTVGKGDFYRVGTAFGDFKVGDLLIASKDNAGSTVGNYNRVIQEDYKGTVTSITAGSGLSGGPITSSGTISHADTSTLNGSTNNTGRNVIQNITVDGFGHVTAVSSFNATDTNTAHSHSAGKGLEATGTGGTSGDVKYSVKLKDDTNQATDAPAISATGTMKPVVLDKSGNLAYYDTDTNTNTAHNHEAGEGLTISGQGGISGTVKYTLAAAASSTLGGIKVGYATTGKNYKVQLDSSNNAFVNVPWTDNNTHYEAKNIIGTTATSVTDATTTNTNTYLNLIENGVKKSSHKIVGDGGTTVSYTVSDGLKISSIKYSFTGGDGKFTVTPSTGSASSVEVGPEWGAI